MSTDPQNLPLAQLRRPCQCVTCRRKRGGDYAALQPLAFAIPELDTAYEVEAQQLCDKLDKWLADNYAKETNENARS